MALDKEDIKQLIAILQKGLADEETEVIEVKPQRKRRKRSTPKRKSKNLFDNMAEASMHKEDVEIDKKLRKYPPTQRSRSYKPVKVKCRVCGKEDIINPSLVESVERYKCNKCATSAG